MDTIFAVSVVGWAVLGLAVLTLIATRLKGADKLGRRRLPVNETKVFQRTPEEDWDTLACRRWSDLDSEQKLRRVRATFHHAIVGEPRRALPHIKIGCAILAFCALDYLGSLLAGGDASEKNFKSFCRVYLCGVDARYSPKDLYNTRCRMVHNYNLTGAYMISWAQGEGGPRHLVTHPLVGGKPILLLENFLDDIANAGEEMFVAALSDDELFTRILTRSDSREPLGYAGFSAP